MIDYCKHLINANSNIKEAFRKLNDVPKNLTLFVTDTDGKMVGTLTDGDIRRGFLQGLDLNDNVSCFMSAKFHYLNELEIAPARIREIKNVGVKLLPVLDHAGHIQRIIDFTKVKTVIPVDAVIMAGGRGERLRPLTDNTPKSLLKIGNKPIIEHILSHLCNFGIRNYFIVIRHLGEQIENYLGDGAERNINIHYIREARAMGTMGSVSRISTFNHDHVLVMNADLFTNINLEDFYKVFLDERSDMAVATVPYTVDIPYAILNYEEDKITGLKEKPSYTYHSNAGVYLVNKKLFKLIPVKEYFNATDLIQAVIENDFKVVRYPIIGYWIDIGKPEDYLKVQEIAKHIGNEPD